MKYGEVKKIKSEHPSYKDFLACCEFIRHHEWDVLDNYYLIISPDEIRKENLIAYQYINKLETALNEKKFLK